VDLTNYTTFSDVGEIVESCNYITSNDLQFVEKADYIERGNIRLYDESIILAEPYQYIIDTSPNLGSVIPFVDDIRLCEIASFSVGEHSISFPYNLICDVLIVGGGGSGAIGLGGGSSGGLIYSSNVLIPSGTYLITVGAGGINADGGYSSAFGVIAYGGMKATTLSGATKYLENDTTGSVLTKYDINSVALAGGAPYTGTQTISHTYNTVVTASGATATQVSGNSGYHYYRFTNNGTITFDKNTTCEVFMIGGGGGGGDNHSGGGGAGAYRLQTLTLNAGTYTVIVGAGGAGR